MKTYFKRIGLLIIVFLLAFQANAQFEGMSISPDAKISLITCSSGDDLYAVFGHSAVRVQDQAQGMDVIFNYGTFDFNEPNFYLKFARGKLMYKLSAAHFQDFVYSYAQDNRSVYEQELKLTPEQKQKYWLFLTNNYLPENRFYLYDFFFDNCATRIRDGLEATFPNQINFNISQFDKDYSFRNLIDLYLPPQPWGDFGIDLALGARIDKEATPYEYMFLPDYLSEGFANATIQQNGQAVPLTGKKEAVFLQSPPAAASFSFFTPTILSWLLLLVIVGVTVFDIKKNSRSRILDVILFFSAGLIGIILLLLWFATDHQATANNFSLLWALPTHLIVALYLGKKVLPTWVAKYMAIAGLVAGILTISWWLLPQQPHAAFIPLALTLLVRAEYIVWFSKKKEPLVAKV